MNPRRRFREQRVSDANKIPPAKHALGVRMIGSLKSVSWVVGEHCSSLRRYIVRSAGGPARAYVDTSSENEGEKPSRRKPKVSCSKVNLLRVSRSLRRGREA
jgi:hypothetical protein